VSQKSISFDVRRNLKFLSQVIRRKIHSDTDKTNANSILELSVVCVTDACVCVSVFDFCFIIILRAVLPDSE